ncbi:MAG TPA: substrate-binding domain-containing protein [Burkholderiaceae bacterium]|nr:substrate-binding domain-containing protein [Burkholderiaceae bacterium]
MSTLHLLSAGAAQGLVRALEPRLNAELGLALSARFGAVGAMQSLFDAGEPCDVLILTDAMIEALGRQGAVAAATRAPLGRVRTGVAVRRGDGAPDVSTPQALRDALLAADAIYFPDPEKATADIHFMKVLRELGVAGQVAARLHPHPNGATAMRELAAAASRHPIGCTQVTEILYTPGVTLVAPLPPQFELATVYTAAVSARASDAAQAARFIALLTAADTQPLRRGGGFEP